MLSWTDVARSFAPVEDREMGAALWPDRMNTIYPGNGKNRPPWSYRERHWDDYKLYGGTEAEVQ